MVYFAYGLKIKMDDLRAIDIEEHPEIKKRYDPDGKGKYFLITKDHYSIVNIQNSGSVQEIIDQMLLEKENEESFSTSDNNGISCNYTDA